MTKEDFLRSNGWRQLSWDYDKIGFSKESYQLLPLLEAFKIETLVFKSEYREVDTFIESSITLWKPMPSLGACLNCGSVNYKTESRQSVRLHPDDENKTECTVECGDCKNIKPVVWRDADGNALSYSEDMTGKYSYATDSVWHSKRALADHCQRHGLVQKGNDVNTKDKRLKRS